MNYELFEKALAHIRKQWPDARPAFGLICGSGWSDVASAFEGIGSLDYAGIPGLGATGVAGHAGKLVRARVKGKELMIFQGRRHFYEGEGWTPVALPVFLLKSLGASALVLTNAAGGVRKDLKPGDLMVIDDHINLFGTNPLIGPHNPAWGPRFPDQTSVYNPELRALAVRVAKSAGIALAHGVYLASSGPTYETPAEIRAYRSLGADAVGMSTVPEASLANAAGMKVLGISCITNYAAGISPTGLTHEEVTATTQATMPLMRTLLQSIFEEMAHAQS